MVIRIVKGYSLFYTKIPKTFSASRVTLDVTSLFVLYFSTHYSSTTFLFHTYFENSRVL